MRTICTVGSDYLGLPEEECSFSYDSPVVKQEAGGHVCTYYQQKEADPDHPSKLPKVCGNCMHWVVLEDKE